jgi:adenosylhomocysteine nucleosidase
MNCTSFGIIGALEEEIAPIRSAMEDVETTRAGGYEFFQGTLADKPTTLVACGIGKVNAAAACALLLERHKPGCIISTGSAGGISSDLSIGDVVIPESLVYHDVDVSGLGFPLGQVPGQPISYSVSEDSISAAERAIDDLVQSGRLPENLRRTRGTIGTGDTFIHDEKKIKDLKRNFPQILAVEMESAAIAQVCASFSVPLLVIRSISDVAGKESPTSFPEFLPLAASNSCAIVRRIIGTAEGE